jgi:hypothetical protein
MDALNEIEVLVNRTIRTIVQIAGKVTRFATILLAVAAAICVASFLLGIAALDGGIESVWIVLGIVFATLAVGAAFVARWRVGRVRKHVPAIAAEVRQLIADGKGQSQLIIQEFQNDDDSTTGSAIVVSRRMYGLRGVVGHGVEGSARLTDAVTAITSFPALALMAIGISLVFGFLALVFLLALAL